MRRWTRWSEKQTSMETDKSTMKVTAFIREEVTRILFNGFELFLVTKQGIYVGRKSSFCVPILHLSTLRPLVPCTTDWASWYNIHTTWLRSGLHIHSHWTTESVWLCRPRMPWRLITFLCFCACVEGGGMHIITMWNGFNQLVSMGFM